MEDDGHGAAAGRPPVGGNGLLGMHERVAALGGRLEAGPRPAGGFRDLLGLSEITGLEGDGVASQRQPPGELPADARLAPVTSTTRVIAW